jgi:cytochrome c553
MHPMKTGWAVLVACMSSFALMGCSGDPVEDTGGGGGVKEVEPVDGPNSFTLLTGADATASAMPTPSKWSSCTTCHAAAAQGTNFLAPEIRHIPVSFATFAIRNGRVDSKNAATGMVAFPAMPPAPLGSAVLTDAEVTEIVTWLNSPPKPTAPQALYRDFCGNCHGPMTASGGSVGIQLLAGIAKETVRATVRSGLGMATPAARKEYMPAFDATLLTDAELEQIMTFIGAK